jgi:ABC-type transport system substrate-binding protein
MRDRSSLNVILTTENIELDPVIAKSYQQFQVLNLFLDTLVRKAPGMGFVHGVAESWQIMGSAECPIYNFKISKDSRFHNGDPVLAEDVVFSFRRHSEDFRSMVRSYLNNIVESIVAEGKDEVCFKLRGPYPPFLELLSASAFGIISHKSTAQEIIGSGPYRLESHAGGKWCLKKSPFQEPLPVESYCFWIERDIDKTMSALNSGAVDLAMGSPLEVALSEKLKKNLVKRPAFSLVTTHAILNYSNPFFLEIGNRALIRHILDGVKRKKDVLTHFDQPLDTFLPRGIMPESYYAEPRSPSSEEMVKRLEVGRELRLIFPYGIFLKSSIEKIVKAFEDGGFRFSFINVKGKDLLDPIVRGAYDIIFIPYQGVMSDPDGYLDLLAPDSLMKSAHLPTEEVLKKISEVRFISDRSLRLESYAEILKEWENEHMVVPFSQNGIPIVFQKNLEFPNLDFSDHLSLRDIKIKER